VYLLSAGVNLGRGIVDRSLRRFGVLGGGGLHGRWRRSGGGVGSGLGGLGRGRGGARTLIPIIVVIIVLTIITFVRNGGGFGSRRGRGLNGQRCRSGNRNGSRSRATVRLAVLLKGLALLHGVTTIIEELGIVFFPATNGKVTGVVVVVWLGNV